MVEKKIREHSVLPEDMSSKYFQKERFTKKKNTVYVCVCVCMTVYVVLVFIILPLKWRQQHEINAVRRYQTCTLYKA